MRCRRTVRSERIDANVEQLVGAGAIKGRELPEAGCTVMLQDPEGNEFCVH
jgi:predicted enzyme related to lactoylglutathione lyase